MSENGESRLQSIASMAKLLGKDVGVTMAQKWLMPKILQIFTEHDHQELRRYILSNYDLVENETPPGIKRALRNLGNDPQLRSQYEQVVMTYVTPDNVIHWLEHPEEWLEDEDADEQRVELKACAETIKTTAGGELWLQRQILQIYEYAGIVPQDTTAHAPNESANNG